MYENCDFRLNQPTNQPYVFRKQAFRGEKKLKLPEPCWRDRQVAKKITKNQDVPGYQKFPKECIYWNLFTQNIQKWKIIQQNNFINLIYISSVIYQFFVYIVLRKYLQKLKKCRIENVWILIFIQPSYMTGFLLVYSKNEIMTVIEIFFFKKKRKRIIWQYKHKFC